jgi:hypothetical protein
MVWYEYSIKYQSITNTVSRISYRTQENNAYQSHKFTMVQYYTMLLYSWYGIK